MNLPINKLERRGTEWIASGTVHDNRPTPVRISIRIEERRAVQVRDSLVKDRQPVEIEIQPSDIVEVSLEP